MENIVRYKANNSGGSWWLADEDWRALEKAGWTVEWFRNDPYYKSDRFLGALASSATRTGLSLGDAIAEWERITGQESSALGCECCGTPHYFAEETGDGHYIRSYSPEFPLYGDKFSE